MTPTIPFAVLPLIRQGCSYRQKFELDKESAMALSKLFMTPEKDLEDKKFPMYCLSPSGHEFLAVLADHVRFQEMVQVRWR